MPVVKMDLGAASALAASFRRDGLSLVDTNDELNSDSIVAHDLLRRSQPSQSAALNALGDIAARLDAMATDLEWRVDLLADADTTASSRFGTVTGSLPDRSLDSVMLSDLEVAAQIVNGTPVERAVAIREAAIRAEQDSDFAAALIEHIGSAGLVSIWANVMSDASSSTSSRAYQLDSTDLLRELAGIQIYAIATGRQDAITVVNEVTAGLHFLEQDRNLDLLGSHFRNVDTAAHGGAADGHASFDDLLAIASGTGALAAAATWVLAHRDVYQFLMVGRDQTDYLAGDPGLPFAIQDFRTLTFNEIDEYRHMRNAAFTLWPLMPLIDVAAAGDMEAADGHLSEHDYEIALGWPGLTDHQRAAIRQVLAEGAFDTKSQWGTALTVAGLVPVVGDVVDGTAMLYYLTEGNWREAGFYGVGLLPIPGLSGTSAKVSSDMAKRYVTHGLRGAVDIGAREFSKRTAELSVKTVTHAVLPDSAGAVDMPAILRDRPHVGKSAS